MSSSNDSRWWEFYGVRYAMGTVVGALVIYFIFSSNEHLQKLLFLPSDPADFGMAHITLLAAYGLAYCYVASAPILIMHSCRMYLWTNKSNWWRTGGLILLSIFVGTIYYCITPSKIAFEPIHRALALTVFVIVLLLQISLLIMIFRDSAKFSTEYYRILVINREQPSSRPFVESYRHLREHGNSFFIVLFEFWLGFVISAFTNAEKTIDNLLLPDEAIRNLFLITFIWITPACFIWFFGNKLEHSLVQGKISNQQL